MSLTANPTGRRRPPGCVALVARTHWLMGAVIILSALTVYAVTRGLVAFRPSAAWITFGMGSLYLLGGTMVWFGLPFGRFVSQVCTLLYLARPQLGSHIWETMNLPEFKAHFVRASRDDSAIHDA
jgi:hypothetical protein